MNPPCARCNKTVYPTEKLNCLDKVWHKMCFKCESCGMTLNMKNYKGYNKLPYCNAHYPTTKHTTVADTPENRRISQNTKMQSNIQYHAAFEESRGHYTAIQDDPEIMRNLKNTKKISLIEYHKQFEEQRERGYTVVAETAEMERVRKNQEIVSQIKYHEDFEKMKGTKITVADDPETLRTMKNMKQSSDLEYKGIRQMNADQEARRPLAGNSDDYDPMNDQWGSVTNQPYSGGQGQQFTETVAAPAQQRYQQQPGKKTLRGKGAQQKKEPEPEPAPEEDEEEAPREPKKFNMATFALWGGANPNLIKEPSPPPPEPEKKATNKKQKENKLSWRTAKFGAKQEPEPEPQPQPQQQQQQQRRWGQKSGQQQQQQQQQAQPPQQQQQSRNQWSNRQQQQQMQQQQQQQQQMQQQQQQQQKFRGFRQQGGQPQPQEYYAPAPQPPPPAPSGGMVGRFFRKKPMYKAMYDYVAADDDEVSFIEGDVITDVEHIDEGWMTGRVQRTNDHGMLPSNYVERCN